MVFKSVNYGNGTFGLSAFGHILGNKKNSQSNSATVPLYQLSGSAASVIDLYNKSPSAKSRLHYYRKHRNDAYWDDGLDAYMRPLAQTGKGASYDDYVKFCNQATTANKKFESSCVDTKKSLGGLGSVLSHVGVVLANFVATALISFAIEKTIEWLDKLDNKLHKTLEDVRAEYDEAKQKTDEAKSDLEGINKELETTQNKITEILSKGSLTFVDNQELEKLRETTAELYLQKKLYEDILKQQNAAELTKLYDKFDVEQKPEASTRDRTWYENLVGFFAEINYPIEKFNSSWNPTFQYNRQLEYKDYQKIAGHQVRNYDERLAAEELMRNDVIKSGDGFSDYYVELEKVIDAKNVVNKAFGRYNELLEKDSLSTDEYKSLDAAVDYLKRRAAYLQEYITTARSLGDTSSDQYNEWTTEYDRITATFYPTQAFSNILDRGEYESAKKELANLEKAGKLTAESLEELYNGNDSVKRFIDYLKELGVVSKDNAFEDIAAQINKASTASKNAGASIPSATSIYTNLKEKTETLSDAYAQMSSNGELSAETVSKLVDKYPDLLDYIEVEGDQIKINKDLIAEKINLIKEEKRQALLTAKATIEAERDKALARLASAPMTDAARRSGERDLFAIDEKLSEVENKIALLDGFDPFDFTKTKQKTDSGDKIKAAFEAEYDILKAEKEKMDAGFAWDTSIIADAEDYYNKVGALNDKFFKNDKDHAEEYGKYSLEVLNGRRDLVLQEFETEKRRIELADKEYGKNSLNEKLSAYTAMKQRLHELAEEYRATMRAAGASQEWIENSEYIKELQDKWWDAEDAAIDSVVNEYKRWVDAQKDAIEKSIDYYDHLIDKQKAFIDGEKSLYDAENDIRDIRRDIEKELRTNKALSEYLDEDTRKLLFNEDDYNHLSTVLDGISSEIGSINAWYNSQINSLTEDTWYLEEEITAEYERRLAVEEKKYELARQQLDLEKKKLELNNVLNERNIRMLTKNENGDYEWTYVHDTEKAAEIVGEISDIESEIGDIKVKSAQEASIAEKERLTSIYGTINGAAEQRKKELDESVDGLEKVIDEMKSPILEFTDIVTAASKTMNETIKKYFGGNIKIGDYNAIPSKNNSGATGSSSNSSSGGASSTSSSSSKRSSSDGRTSYSSEEQAIAIEGMRQNSEAWLNTKDADERKQLEKENQRIGKSYGLTYDAASGKWYRDKDKTQLAYTVTKHADGTLFAEKGFSLLNDGAGLEILRTKSGALVDLTGGETVFNNKQTEFLYKLSKSGTFPRLAGNETNTNYNFKGDIVLKDVQNPQDFIRALSKELKQSSFKNK